MAFPRITRRRIFALVGGSSTLTAAAYIQPGAVNDSTSGAIPFPRTPAETAVGVMPTSYEIPSHPTAGGVFLERYGGGNGATAPTNNTAFSSALVVAGQ